MWSFFPDVVANVVFCLCIPKSKGHDDPKTNTAYKTLAYLTIPRRSWWQTCFERHMARCVFESCGSLTHVVRSIVGAGCYISSRAWHKTDCRLALQVTPWVSVDTVRKLMIMWVARRYESKLGGYHDRDSKMPDTIKDTTLLYNEPVMVQWLLTMTASAKFYTWGAETACHQWNCSAVSALHVHRHCSCK